MTAKLNSLFDALRSGEAVRGSTSEMCAIGLAAGREDVLPAPYTTIADAWRRLNDEQRLWVEEKNARLAAEAAIAAIHFGTVAWH
jgi:hypothetical protein